MRVSFATEPGSPERPNEDFVAASPTVAVVLDGLTAPDALGTGCTHGTSWYVHQLGIGLLRAATARVSSSLAAVVSDVIADVASLHDETCDLSHPGTPSASVVLLRESPETVDYLLLFDSVLLLRDSNDVAAVTDDRIYAVAQSEREATRKYLIGTVEHQNAVHELVDAERRHRNKDSGYWVAGAIPDVAQHAITGTVDRGQLHSAALLTDGVSCLVNTYGTTDWSGLLGRLGDAGPAKVIDEVRTLEATDPDGSRWPRYKRADDATVILCEF